MENIPPSTKNNSWIKITAWIIGIIIILPILLLLISLPIISLVGPGIIKDAIYKKTSFPVSADKFDINPWAGRVELKNFKIENSTEFGGGTFINIPQFVFVADVFSLTGTKPHIKELTLDLSELRVVKNAAGVKNTEYFANKLKPEEKKTPDQPQKASKAQPQITIDKLSLKIGTVTMVDATRTPAREQKITLNIKFQRENITDMKALQADLATSALMQSALGGIGDVGGLMGSLTGDTLEGATKASKATAEELKKSAKGLQEAVKGFKNILRE